MYKLMILLLMALTLSVSAKGFKSPKYKEPHASIELGYGSNKHSAEPVYIYHIDGIDVSKKTFVTLAPGKHIIKCKSTVDLNEYDFLIPKGEKFVNTDKNNTIELTVENGKTYYLGFSTKSEKLSEWKPVVFKVEDMLRH